MEAPTKRDPQAASSPKPDVRSDTAKCTVLHKFATLLGHAKEKSSRTRELVQLLSSPNAKVVATDGHSPKNQEDDIVLTVPTLDLRWTDDNKEVLPDVGKHSEVAGTFDGSSTESSTNKLSRPAHMTASVLALASAGKTDDRGQAASSSSPTGDPDANINNNIRTCSWTRSTVTFASAAMGSNLSESFSSLLNSRLRAWTLLLLKHSLSTGSGESRSRLLSMLAAKINVAKVETKFQTLPLPESATTQAKPKDADIILPLLLEVSLQISIQDKLERVTLRAPGTISALFAGEKATDGLKKCHVRLDTSVLLKAMVDHARIVVLKAVATATQTDVPTNEYPKGSAAALNHQAAGSALKPANEAAPPLALGSFSSALQLTGKAGHTPDRLSKARTSALRLNSVLHGKSASSSSKIGIPPAITGLKRQMSASGMRKTRSVRWDETERAPTMNAALAPDPKKLRVVQTASKLKSFKSFGRPHAGDFGSGPRNATFGEYGRPGGVWGRDGRLAHHPAPMRTGAAVDEMGNLTQVPDKNATFDNLRGMDLKRRIGSLNALPTSRSSAASAGAALLGQLSGPSTAKTSNVTGLPGQNNASSMGLPRTATALENSLMRKWS